MTEYNEDLEARLTAMEGRIAFSEQRLAALERGGKVTTKRASAGTYTRGEEGDQGTTGEGSGGSQS